MLDIVAAALDKNDVPYLHLKGTLRQRAKILEAFQTEQINKVLLMCAFFFACVSIVPERVDCATGRCVRTIRA